MMAIIVMALLMSTDVQYFIMRMVSIFFNCSNINLQIKYSIFTYIHLIFLSIKFPENVSICQWLGASSSCHAGKLMGYLAVYRIGLAIALYHLILMFSTCGMYCPSVLSHFMD